MIPSLKPTILFLGGPDVSPWLETLRKVASALDGVVKAIDQASVQRVLWRDYDLVILDAGVFNDLPSTIAWICSQYPETRIVVFSSAPTWKQAREAMLAGAMDYARKSLNREYILSTLKKNLARQAPSWQHQR